MQLQCAVIAEWSEAVTINQRNPRRCCRGLGDDARLIAQYWTPPMCRPRQDWTADNGALSMDDLRPTSSSRCTASHRYNVALNGFPPKSNVQVIEFSCELWPRISVFVSYCSLYHCCDSVEMHFANASDRAKPQARSNVYNALILYTKLQPVRRDIDKITNAFLTIPDDSRSEWGGFAARALSFHYRPTNDRALTG